MERCWVSPAGELTLWLMPADMSDAVLRQALAKPSGFAPKELVAAYQAEFDHRCAVAARKLPYVSVEATGWSGRTTADSTVPDNPAAKS